MSKAKAKQPNTSNGAVKERIKTPPTPPMPQPPPTFNLELMSIEMRLIYTFLQNAPFPTVEEKQIAASIQQKIERIAAEGPTHIVEEADNESKDE